jgi:hypothetical protein
MRIKFRTSKTFQHCPSSWNRHLACPAFLAGRVPIITPVVRSTLAAFGKKYRITTIWEDNKGCDLVGIIVIRRIAMHKGRILLPLSDLRLRLAPETPFKEHTHMYIHMSAYAMLNARFNYIFTSLAALKLYATSQFIQDILTDQNYCIDHQ